MTQNPESGQIAIDPQRDITYSPDNIDAYAEHLSDVNTVKEVVANADIVSQQGIVLLKKGQRITKALVERIVQHKLLRPIEDSVAISDTIDAAKLQGIIESKLGGPAEKKLHQEYNLREELVRSCAFFCRFPILTQKLTVLSLQMPQEFDKALIVAWGSLIVSQYMKLPADERDNVFVAGLMHDIGMLHIAREITGKEGNLTPAEWRAIKSHVIIGQKIMEQNRNLPASIGKAIVEHHEVCDGTGYPSGLFQQDLGVPGQIIGMLDAVFAIAFHKLAPKNLGTRPLIPILQINSYTYLGNVCNAVLRLLRNYEHANAPVIGKALQESLAAKAKFLADYHERMATITALLTNHSGKRQVRAAMTILEHLNVLLRSSGILNPGYCEELEKRATASPTDIDVEDLVVMLQEFQWQLVKLTRTLHGIAEQEKVLPAEECRALQQALKGLPAISAR
jgi:HD-GYP domain-containing protein (c-di-GMP phosphodiesterase class II)